MSAKELSLFPFSAGVPLRGVSECPFDPRPGARTPMAAGEPFAFGHDIHCANRICIQPMEGRDAQPDGAPGEATCRRYLGFAAGGAGLIWTEAIAISPRARCSGRQLCLHEGNLEKFKSLVEEIRAAALRQQKRDVILIAQLTHPGRFSRGPDGALPRIPDRILPDPDNPRENSGFVLSMDDEALQRIAREFLDVARLALQAGFDGVDIKSSHNDLNADLLNAVDRRGLYGGNFESRSRLLLDIFEDLQQQCPRLLPALRLSIGGISASSSAGGPNPREAILLLKALAAKGLRLLNPHFYELDTPGEFDQKIERALHFCRSVKQSVPSLAVVAGGFSAGLPERLAEAARDVVGKGFADFFGLGRAALADPGASAAIIAGESPDPAQSCLNCGACDRLLRHDRSVGCVVRAPERHAESFRWLQHIAGERLREEAKRCRDCFSSDCSTACPGGMDPRGFVRAFSEGDFDRAYAIARADNPLPELSAWLCPSWMYCQKACVENAIGSGPLPIREIQLWLGRWGKTRGLTGLRLPDARTGKRVAVVGGGPTGIAAAASLVEFGHDVVLYERSFRLGGIPAQAIPSKRLPREALEEIDVLLAPAIGSGHLRISFGRELGTDLSLPSLRSRFNAILLAPGLWRERELEPGRNDRMDAVTFLQLAVNGILGVVPETIALVCGGDSAMDAATVAREHGAKRIYLIYEGPLSEMHWHAPAEEFRRPDTTVLPMCRILRRDPAPEGGYNLRLGPSTSTLPNPSPVPLTDSGELPGLTLHAGLVIEALGLETEFGIRNELAQTSLHPGSPEPLSADAPGMTPRDGESNIFAAGALVNGGASVVQCIREGIETAQSIHNTITL